ncbi:MAG TPA: phosphonate ABC transporter, permease protein PhnE [Candidatus Thermoplasmatota archaeon]|nr:phosphonate ABC transporter, permease protein PhnE [Candidatus Thermoplasmatota archaeon]
MPAPGVNGDSDARRIGLALTAATLAGILVWSLLDVGFSFSRLAQGASNLGTLAHDLFPPDLDPDLMATLAEALVETVQMAYLGTVIGAALALPLAVVAARTLGPPLVAPVVRKLLAVIRTIPSLLWALVFVIMVGLGPLAGTLGLALYTLGYLGKLFYEAIEGVDPEVIEAVRSTGASRWQLARHAILPEAGNALLSQAMFVFEYNVRASSILGFVGAGGIGFYLFRYMQLFEYRKLATALLLLLVAVLLIEGAGGLVRRRFLPEAGPTPAA